MPTDKTEQINSDETKTHFKKFKQYSFVALECVVTDRCIASVQAAHEHIVFSYLLTAQNKHEQISEIILFQS